MNASELKEGSAIEGRYILKRYLGSGSFGEVWVAHDSILGLDVAIKLYISLDQRGQDEFKDEYRVAFGLSHQNILTAQHYSVWEHRPYLVMKFCSQGSASGLGDDVTERQVWQFIHDVADGLMYLHRQDPPIIHQDIKPENILIDDQGHFMITDFGISKKMRSTMRKQSKRAIEAGAISYMGPERFLAEPLTVMASDIWSLGVSIYELCTGELPFMGQGGGMMNAGAEIPRLGSKWSANLNDVMQACLQKETWDRPTAEQLSEYAKLMLDGKNISFADWKKRGDSVGVHPVVKSRSYGKLIFAAAAVALLVGVGILSFAWYDRNTTEKNAQIASVENRYNSLKSMAENNVQIGSPQNYMALIEAKSLIDSLNEYQNIHQFISDNPQNSTEDLQRKLNDKIEEAQAAWTRSAQGQEEIAEDYGAAIQHYHVAARLKPSPNISQMLSNIASSRGCDGAYMAVTNTSIAGDVLTVHYNGLNSHPISGVILRYEISGDDTPPVRGVVTATIEPGDNHTIRISLGDKLIPSRPVVALETNHVRFYNGKIEG